MILDKEKLKDIFDKAKIRYKEIQCVDIKLRFSKGMFFTMRASVKINSLFNKKRKYIVYVNFRRKDVLSKLSENDLIGWFGHELAHIIEYETMSNFELFLFTIKYLFNPKFRFSVEKRINVFTCNNVFSKELFGVWKKFLSLDDISKKYKEYVKKCRPDWKDIEQSALSHGISKEVFESFK